MVFKLVLIIKDAKCGDKIENKQTLFGPEEKRKNDASMFSMLTKRSNTKSTRLYFDRRL